MSELDRTCTKVVFVSFYTTFPTYDYKLLINKLHSPIARVTQKKFAFGCHRLPDVFFTLDVFLAPINNSNVTCTFRQQREK